MQINLPRPYGFGLVSKKPQGPTQSGLWFPRHVLHGHVCVFEGSETYARVYRTRREFHGACCACMYDLRRVLNQLCVQAPGS